MTILTLIDNGGGLKVENTNVKVENTNKNTNLKVENTQKRSGRQFDFQACST